MQPGGQLSLQSVKSPAVVLILPPSSALLAVALLGACSDATTPRPVFSADSGADTSAAATDAEPVVIDAGTDAAVCAMPHSFGSPRCNECLATNCCPLLGACAADTNCSMLRDCMLECMNTGDTKGGVCADACFSKYPDDSRLWENLEGCWAHEPPCRFHCTITRR